MSCKMTTRMVEAVRKLNGQGLNDIEIAQELGVGKQTAHYWRRKMGLPTVRHHKVYTAYDRETSQFLAEGSARECADRLGITVQTLRRYVWAFERGEYYKYEIHSELK